MFGFARVGNSLTPPRVATMNAYDSIERGAADECEPLTGRRPRTFTLTQLLVACVAVSCCTLAATTVVNTHRGLANFGDPGTEAIKQQYEDVMKKQAEAVKAAASRYEAMIKQAEHIDAMETQAEAIREAKEAEAMEKQAEAIRKHMEAMKKQAEAKAAADKEMGPENAEKKRKAEEKERECDRQATEKRNQCLAQPALGSSQNRWSAVGRYGS
jgi:Fe2+ transport system protein B